MKALPRVPGRFPLYKVKEVGKVIAYNKNRIIFLPLPQKFSSCSEQEDLGWLEMGRQGRMEQMGTALGAHLGTVPGGAVREPGGGKGSGSARHLSQRAFLGTLPLLLRACCSLRAQIHLSHLQQPQGPPPTSAQSGRDKLGTHRSWMKKEGGNAKEAFSSPQRAVQAQLSPFRKEPLVQVSNSLPVPAGPSNTFCHRGSGVTQTQHLELNYRDHTDCCSQKHPLTRLVNLSVPGMKGKSQTWAASPAPSLLRHPPALESRLGQRRRLRGELGAAPEAPWSRWDQLPAAVPGFQALLCLQAAFGSAGDAKGWARERSVRARTHSLRVSKTFQPSFHSIISADGTINNYSPPSVCLSCFAEKRCTFCSSFNTLVVFLGGLQTLLCVLQLCRMEGTGSRGPIREELACSPAPITGTRLLNFQALSGFLARSFSSLGAGNKGAIIPPRSQGTSSFLMSQSHGWLKHHRGGGNC